MLFGPAFEKAFSLFFGRTRPPYFENGHVARTTVCITERTTAEVGKTFLR